MSKQPLYPHKTPSELGQIQRHSVTPSRLILEKRITTVHGRYQISCSYCGFLSSEMTLKEALDTAKRALQRHTTKGENIDVFDIMAKYGTCDTWGPNGKCLHYKKSEAGTRAEINWAESQARYRAKHQR
jgi:hypothetical protein